MGNFFVAAKAIIAVKNRVLILRKSKAAGGKYGEKWDLPGGKVNFGETLEQALIRQVKEEIECDICIIKPYKFWSFLMDENTQIIGTTFLCRMSCAGDVKLSQEHSEFKWIYEDELKNCEFLGNIKNELKECFMNININ